MNNSPNTVGRGRWLQLLASPGSALFTHRELTVQLAKRDVLGRYRGASFGLTWSLISPFLMLCVYTFAFGSVLGGRWPRVESGDDSFAMIVFVGLIVHGLFAECVNRAPMLIVSNPNFVKRVIFPLEILPWPMLISALFHTLMNVLVFVILRLVLDGQFSWTIVMLPAVLLPFAIMLLGLSWLLASLGVYIRDVIQVTGVMSMALLFLSSALIPLESVPESYRWIFRFNPLTPIIDQARNVMLWNRMPDWLLLAEYSAGALVVCYLGYAWFALTRRGFGDVL